MKKRYLFGFMALILAAALAFSGCDLLNLGDDNNNNNNNNNNNKDPTYKDLVITGQDSSGAEIKTTFSTTRTTKNEGEVMPYPDGGDKYTITKSGTQASGGTITVENKTFITFTPTTGGNVTFKAVLYNNNSSLAYPDGIPSTSTGKITQNENSGSLTFTTNLSTDEVTYNAGQTVTPLEVNASGSDLIVYQWYNYETNSSDGKPIGTNSKTYTPNATGFYYVCIANSSGNFKKSNTAKVTIIGSSGATGNDDITGSLGASVVDDTKPSDIKITGSVAAKKSFDIPSGTTLTIEEDGELIIPVGITITVKGKLFVGNGKKNSSNKSGTLTANGGNVVVASGGELWINADGTKKTQKDDSNDTTEKIDGILNGTGKITINKTGKMYIPSMTTNQSFLSTVKGSIKVESGGELYLVGYDKDGKAEINYPWIGTKDSQNFKKEPVGADFTLDNAENSGSITITINSNPVSMLLDGNTTILGPKYTGTDTDKKNDRGTVEIGYPLYVNPDKTLTIGDGSKITKLKFSSGGSITMYSGNGNVTLTFNSMINASSSTLNANGSSLTNATYLKNCTVVPDDPTKNNITKTNIDGDDNWYKCEKIVASK